MVCSLCVNFHYEKKMKTIIVLNTQKVRNVFRIWFNRLQTRPRVKSKITIFSFLKNFLKFSIRIHNTFLKNTFLYVVINKKSFSTKTLKNNTPWRRARRNRAKTGQVVRRKRVSIGRRTKMNIIIYRTRHFSLREGGKNDDNDIKRIKGEKRRTTYDAHTHTRVQVGDSGRRCMGF